MEDKPNKDSIKEMLEGHKKKFNVIAVIVGIAVVLIIVFGGLYIVETLNTTPKTSTEENLNKYMENANKQVENSNSNAQNQKTVSTVSENVTKLSKPANNIPSAQQKQPAKTQAVQKTGQTAAEQTQTQPKTYTVSGKNTSSKNGSMEQKSGKNGLSGPQIINPYAQKKSKKTAYAGKPVSKHKASAKRHIRHKSHKYISVKKYALQVSSNLNKKFVSITLSKLKRCGYRSYVRIKIINNKVYRRVMVGPIRGYTAAKDEAVLIKRQLRLKYIPIIKKYDKIP